MAFLTKTGDEETDYNKIFENYLKGKFRFDAVANFPLQLFCFVSSTERMRYYSYFNLIHLLRIKKLREWFRIWLKKLNIKLVITLSDKKKVGLIFRRTKLFAKQNFRHLHKISSLCPSKDFWKFVFVTHYVCKCTMHKVFRKKLNFAKYFVGLNYLSDIISLCHFQKNSSLLSDIFFVR